MGEGIAGVFGFFEKVAELHTWHTAFREATGERFFATVVMGMLLIVILALWRLPQLGALDLSWFNGRVATALVLLAVAVFTIAFLIVAVGRLPGTSAERAAPRAVRENDPVKRTDLTRPPAWRPHLQTENGG